VIPFSAYFDASGTVDSPVLTVAGFVSTDKKWARFDAVWSALLKREGIKCFHMTDFVSGKREFSHGWNTERRRALIKDLEKCIQENVNKSFRVAMLVSDYRKVNEAFVLSENYGMPYGICAIMCVYELRLWAERKNALNHLQYFFEDGDKGKGQLETTHKRIYGASAFFLTKSQATPLQAADFAAWKTRAALEKALRPDHTLEKGKELLRSLEGLKRIPKDGGVITKAGLVRWCEKFGVQRR
jgi:hypothetical protein